MKMIMAIERVERYGFLKLRWRKVIIEVVHYAYPGDSLIFEGVKSSDRLVSIRFEKEVNNYMTSTFVFLQETLDKVLKEMRKERDARTHRDGGRELSEAITCLETGCMWMNRSLFADKPYSPIITLPAGEPIDEPRGGDGPGPAQASPELTAEQVLTDPSLTTPADLPVTEGAPAEPVDTTTSAPVATPEVVPETPVA